MNRSPNPYHTAPVALRSPYQLFSHQLASAIQSLPPAACRAGPPSARLVAAKLGDPLSLIRGLARLFVNGFDRFIYHSAGEAIDRHMDPVMLLSFHDEVILKAASIGLEMT